MARHLRKRRNLAKSVAEAWRPPLIEGTPNREAGLRDRLRRYFDLQYGSVWSDLRLELADVKGRVLDVGCGSQPFRRLLPRTVEYLGIDVAGTEAQFGYRAAGVRYFSGDQWPVSDEWADVVLCTETLEHVPDPRKFLGEAQRCVRRSGKLLLTVPFAARWHFVPYDFWRFTPSSLKLLLEEAGFTDVVVAARGNPLTVACYKGMAVVLGLLAGKRQGYAPFLSRGLGLSLLPQFMWLSLIANLSSSVEWGEDCLGYTVLARRPGP